ncbi:MAG: hypothetical protein ABIL09_19825, partial [Gemmatimonadota bacterium]
AMTMPSAADVPAGGPYWNAPDRAARVAALIPGRNVPRYTPETLFADWTREQAERWAGEHGSEDPADACRRYADAAPTDAALTDGFPTHIAPFARPPAGSPGGTLGSDRQDLADQVLVSYCPVCGSRSFGLRFDGARPYERATTTCCQTDLFARDEDWPAGSPLKPNGTARFLHLDDTWVEVPCTTHCDPGGNEWELFIPTIFAHRRWLEQGCDLIKEYMVHFRTTADPLYAHKIAVILDRVADTYRGLPLGAANRVCMGRDGAGLARAEWESVPRPAIFEVSYLGPWSKRDPYSSPGWLNMLREHIWVEPFARVRHHPAFKQVSRDLHGDPEALDRKVRGQLLRELSLMFQSVFSQKLLHNYQEAVYIDLWLLGILAEEPILVDFAGPCQEASMYNHTYQDGLNGEGAPNYMWMPGSYYYPVLSDPEGWLRYHPRFLEENPFYRAASREMHSTRTVRGLSLEWGDQHEHVFSPEFTSDSERVRENERLGSRNWAGYGVGVLRVGGPGHRLEVGLAYTRASLHNAQDALSLECWVDGVPVMRRGGYAAWWSSVDLQWERPEFAALRQMDYPHPIDQADGSGFDSWSWVWTHSPLNQNTLTVDEVGTGKGWGYNRGYGECLTFKGGEPAGEPGSGFQVLDVLDHYSWSQVGKEVRDWRRTLIGVEGPEGRGYAVDLVSLRGGARHALYNQAWARRAGSDLPAPRGRADSLAEVFFGGELPEDSVDCRNYRHVTRVERAAAEGATYGVTWQQDYGAWGQRSATGEPYRRPVPDGVGRVRLRFIGVNQGDGRTELLSGKGPWVGWLRQPLPNGQQTNGNVAFAEARDFLVEYRAGGTDQHPLESAFVHVLEGYREGEASAIERVQVLDAESTAGDRRQITALRLDLRGGHTDMVLYQAGPGTARLPDGTRTDARYALVRTGPSGGVLAVEACRGTFLRRGPLDLAMTGDLGGIVVDLIGDITGTRLETALIVKPDRPWPTGGALRGRQLLIRVESPARAACNEGFRVDEVTKLPGGLVRVGLQDHAPLIASWHEVTELPADRPNVLRTWRPMSDHGNGPWYAGLPVWFPERDRTYTVAQVNEVGGGYGGDLLELAGGVDLAADGIRPGDWYAIAPYRPGQRVDVASELSWRVPGP